MSGPLGDLAFAVAVIGTALVALVVVGDASVRDAATLAAVLAAVCGCASVARSFPLIAVSLACLVLLVSGWLAEPAQGIGQAILLVAVFPLIYRLATKRALGWVLAGTVLTASCWQAGLLWHIGAEGVNPSILFSTIGPCAVGLIVASRGRARAALEAQAHELALAQQAYAAESVRSERTRVARELHDIVAHHLSAMVVQANAGRTLARREPARAAEAFDHITQSAHRAADDIGRLVALLEPHSPPPRRSIDELVSRARATGLAIDYRPVGAGDPYDAGITDTAYAVVQEALTNALKHAPGAAIEVSVRASPGRLAVVVTNTPTSAVGPRLGLASTGGGNGLDGLRARVVARGGTFGADANEDGGWRVTAVLPATAGGM